MKYIDSWLNGLGLDYILPKLKENGITTPKKLAALTLRDMFEIGVEDPEDRKKLYFLIQRLQTILNNRSNGEQTKNVLEASQQVDSMHTVLEEEQPKELYQSYMPRQMKQETNATSSKRAAVLTQENIENLDSSKTNISSSGADKNLSNQHTKRAHIDDVPAATKFASITTSDNDDTLLEKKINLLLEKNNLEKKRHSLLPKPFQSSRRELDNFSPLDDSHATHSPITPPARIISPLQSQFQGKKQIHVTNVNSGISKGVVSTAVIASNRSTSSHFRIPKPPPDSDQLKDLIRKSPHPPANKSTLVWSNHTSSAELNYKHQAKPLETSPVKITVNAAPNLVKSCVSKISASISGSLTQSNTRSSEQQQLLLLLQIQQPIVDMPIRVVVRKRPISHGELSRGDYDVMEMDDYGSVYVHEPKKKVDLTKVVETQSFKFDDAFEADESNEVIYTRTVGHLVKFMFEGGKGSCFAYGQTGSGKTFTMMGSNPHCPASVAENAGLYVLAARDIFRLIELPENAHLQVFISCFEIYSGKLFDLLNERSVVKCLEDAKQQVQLPGLTEHAVDSVCTLLELMARAHSQRSTGATGANATSSRSHQILQIVIKTEKVNTAVAPRLGIRQRAAKTDVVLVNKGKLTFIDLAGSERGADTNSSSKQTRLEGAEINTSLLALKEVIRSLERKHGHTPFRGSKLTQVLKDSFVGENPRTCMIACVSPSHSNCEHTLNTLRYADRVKEHQSGNQSSHAADDQLSVVSAPASPPSQVSPLSSDPPARANSIHPHQLSAGPIRPHTAITNANRIPTNSPSTRPHAASTNAIHMPPTSPCNPMRNPGQIYSQGIASPKEINHKSSHTIVSSQPPSPQNKAQSNNAHPRLNSQPSSPVSKSARTSFSRPSSHRSSTSTKLPIKIPGSRQSPNNIVIESSTNSTSEIIRLRTSPDSIARRSSIASCNVNTKSSVSTTSPASKHSRITTKVQTRAPPSTAGCISVEAKTKQAVIDLMTAHKLSISTMVEVMKNEMELVQAMENAENRDSELYVDQLEVLLEEKCGAIEALRRKLGKFMGGMK